MILSKKLLLILLGTIFGLFFLAYCWNRPLPITKPVKNNKIFLTDEMVREYKITDKELMSFQYYINRTLIFTVYDVKAHNNIDSSGETVTRSIIDHKNEIKLQALTPGIAIKVKDSVISVDFGEGIILPFSLEQYGAHLSINYMKINGNWYPDETMILNGVRYMVDAGKIESAPLINKRFSVIVNLLIDSINVVVDHRWEVQKSVAPGKRVKN